MNPVEAASDNRYIQHLTGAFSVQWHLRRLAKKRENGTHSEHICVFPIFSHIKLRQLKSKLKEWKQVFEQHFGAYTLRKSHAMVGLSLPIIMHLWFHIINDEDQFSSPIHLFWSLHWLKAYPTDAAGNALYCI